MRDLKRIYRITGLLVEFWTRSECQDMRFWQMFSYLAGEVYKYYQRKDYFYLEDDEFENILKKILDKKEKS